MLPPSDPSRCHHCTARIINSDASVYFGVTGPFCNVACREAWLKASLEDDGMQPEYDFTGGERGKYAARYAKGVVKP